MNFYEYGFLIVFYPLVGICSSTEWIIPILKYGFRDFVPIWFTKEYTDNYFYFARIKHIATTGLLNGDPVVYEYRNRLHPHNTYQGSLFFCGIWERFIKFPFISYFATTFIYPILHFSVLSWLSYEICGNFAYAVLVASLILIRLPRYLFDIKRVPNILFTSFHLSLLVTAGYFYILNENSIFAMSCLSFLTIISPVISPQNFMISFFFSSGLLVRNIASSQINIPFFALTIFLYAIVAAWSLMNYKEIKRYWEYAHISYYLPLSQTIRDTVIFLILPTLLYVLLLLSDTVADIKIFFTVIIFSMLCSSISAFIFFKSRVYAYVQTIKRGYIITSIFLSMQIAPLLTKDILPFLSLKILSYIILLYIGYLFFSSFRRQLTGSRFEIYKDHDKRELINWASNLNTSDVIVTLDFDAATSLPVYTPAFFYIPQRMLSTSYEEELWDRLYEVCFMFNISCDEFESFINGISLFSNNKNGIKYNTTYQYLMYAKFYEYYLQKTEYSNEDFINGTSSWGHLKSNFKDKPEIFNLPPAFVDKKIEKYREFTVQSPQKLKNNATYALINKMAEFSKPLRMQDCILVFENKTYKVYAIKQS